MAEIRAVNTSNDQNVMKVGCNCTPPEKLEVQWLAAGIYGEAQRVSARQKDDERIAIAWSIMNRRRYLNYLDEFCEYAKRFIENDVKSQEELLKDQKNKFRKARAAAQKRYMRGNKGARNTDYDLDIDNPKDAKKLEKILSPGEEFESYKKIDSIKQAIKNLKDGLLHIQGARDRAYKDFTHKYYEYKNTVVSILSNKEQYASYENNTWKHPMEKVGNTWQMTQKQIAEENGVKDKWYRTDGKETECESLRRAIKIAEEIYPESEALMQDVLAGKQGADDPIAAYAALTEGQRGKDQREFMSNRTKDSGAPGGDGFEDKPVQTIGGTDFYRFLHIPAHLSQYMKSEARLKKLTDRYESAKQK